MRLLTVLLYVPGRKVLQQLLPLALGGGSLWAAQGYCSAKADANSTHAGLDSKAGAQPAVAPTVQSSKAEQPGGTLPNLMAKLMGSNEFANVSCNAPTMHCTLALHLQLAVPCWTPWCKQLLQQVPWPGKFHLQRSFQFIHMVERYQAVLHCRQRGRCCCVCCCECRVV